MHRRAVEWEPERICLVCCWGGESVAREFELYCWVWKCHTATPYPSTHLPNRTSTRSRTSSMHLRRRFYRRDHQVHHALPSPSPCLLPPSSPPTCPQILFLPNPNPQFQNPLLELLLHLPLLPDPTSPPPASDPPQTPSRSPSGTPSRGISRGSSAIWSWWCFPTLTVRIPVRPCAIGISGDLSSSLSSSALLSLGLLLSRR